MNITDFLNLASDYNAGNGQMREIGNIASRYMLVKDLNGILANQPETAFFGYCYKNNLYVDLLPFFIRFFAYWRIDEKYANSSNYGADTFAEGWAPTVDIAKFFYFKHKRLRTAVSFRISAQFNSIIFLFIITHSANFVNKISVYF